MDSKGINLSAPALFACLILSFSLDVSRNPGIAAGLIRLHFHDCFVRGCDASVLLDGPNTEKEGIPNKNSLRGFEVIDAAKAALEAACPGTVSCADIVAFAARDSSFKVGRIYYDVQAGRRDGHVSIDSETLTNLPSPFINASELIKNFASKGMPVDEMVTLSGAHSIGIAHCGSICPPEALTNGTGAANPANLDALTPNRLDNRYYLALKSQKGLMISDQALMANLTTAKLVNYNARFGSLWSRKFAAAMIHMGTLDVLTGRNGEIRRNCHFVN
ncbi:hypothetical protein KY285_007148 [Solanum tuberosum]|nr:hypothetical protein KY285_007148 [Solanum tuberosum]